MEKVNLNMPEGVDEIYKCHLFEPTPGDFYLRIGFDDPKQYHRDIAEKFGDEIGLTMENWISLNARIRKLSPRMMKEYGYNPESISRGGAAVVVNNTNCENLIMLVQGTSEMYGPMNYDLAVPLLLPFKDMGYKVFLTPTVLAAGVPFELETRQL